MDLLARLAANDPQLTELGYGGVPRSVGTRGLVAALAVNTTLTYLALSGQNDDAVARELAGVLERNKALKTLSLWNCNVGADGAGHLAAALGRNTTITALWLSGCNIGDEGARHLAVAL